MSTVTTAVPQGKFATHISHVLDLLPGGPEAVQRITRLHKEELVALEASVSAAREARIAAAQDETAHAVAASTRSQYLLGGALETARRETLRACHQYASAAQAGRLLTEIGRLAEAAAEAAPDGEEAAVSVAELERVLATPLPPAPFQPGVLAFYPSQQFHAGHFADPQGVAHQVHPFAGWASVLEHPDRPAALVPIFLVGTELRTADALLEERGIELQRLT